MRLEVGTRIPYMARCPIEAELAIARRLGFRTPSATSRRTTPRSGPCGRRLPPGGGDRMSGYEVVITKSADQRVQVPRPGSCIGSAYTAYRTCRLPLLP